MTEERRDDGRGRGHAFGRMTEYYATTTLPSRHTFVRAVVKVWTRGLRSLRRLLLKITI